MARDVATTRDRSGLTARIGAIYSDGSMTGDDPMAWWRDGAPARVAVMALDDATTRCRSDMTAHIGARDRDGGGAM